MNNNPKKIVLAYSGGLDTSVIIKWLQEKYSCEVVAFLADIGQQEALSDAGDKAFTLGVKEVYMEDLREVFVRDYIFPMFRANAVYQGSYLLGTAIARPLIAKRQIEIAQQTHADAVAHGATGKGNDQVRFELTYYALQPNIRVIAPWRIWDFRSRTELLAYARQNNIPVAHSKEDIPPYSIDTNILHMSYEGLALEDPWQEPDKDMFEWTVDPEDAPNSAEYVEITFESGNAVAINGEILGPEVLMTQLNHLGCKHGIGRLDIVENRYIGMKSRGVYEAPGATILHLAHRAMETLTLDGETMQLKEELMPRYAQLIYRGYWFSPEREALQSLIDHTQNHVSGVTRMKLYKGQARVVGRQSEASLYLRDIATFEQDQVYNHALAEGFIQLNALRLKIQQKPSYTSASTKHVKEHYQREDVTNKP